MTKKLVLFLLVLSIGRPAFAEPNTVMEVNQEDSEQKTRLSLGPELVLLSRSGRSLTSFAAHLGLEYGLSERLALGGAIHQGFSSSGFLSPNFTKFSVTLAYALTGALVLKADRVSLNSRKVFATEPYGMGGFRGHLYFSEYLFPVTGGSLLFPSLGIAASYEFPSVEKYNFALGLRADYLFNAADSLTSIQPFVRFLFWI